MKQSPWCYLGTKNSQKFWFSNKEKSLRIVFNPTMAGSLLWPRKTLLTHFPWRMGPPWGISGKKSTYKCRIWRFDPWIGKIPWRKKWQPTPVFLPGKSHSPWDLELDRTYRINNTTEWTLSYSLVRMMSFLPILVKVNGTTKWWIFFPQYLEACVFVCFLLYDWPATLC